MSLLATAHVRIARPTDNIDALLPFYRDGLGFEVLGSFADHEGFDGVMLGYRAAGYHLEFTRHRSHDAGMAPTQDNLLIFYLPDQDAHAQAVAQMETAGFTAVASFNPYWDRCGKTFEDPDGYRVVLANMSPPHLSSTMAWSQLGRLCLVAAAITAVTGQQTRFHPDWPRWCGKVYQAGYPNFDPGGQTVLPAPSPDAPLLHVLIQPRYSLYLEDEDYGEFIVDAELSQYHGTPWPNAASSFPSPNKLVFSINIADTTDPLVQNTLVVNTTGNLIRFPLSLLKPARLEPIEVVLYGAPEGGTPTWTANTTLLYLPTKPAGSITRVDNLHGGLHFRSAATNHAFTPFFPYGFFASYDGFLRENDPALVDRYAALGLTAMVPLTTFPEAPAILNHISQNTSIRILYNLRDIYRNLTAVRANILAARDTPGLFGYWSADEPDGWQDPLSLPRDAYALIRELDPYHPVALTLNCADYYFGPYSAPADFLTTDPYPIGINATFSKWGTACNLTHGDCGCDDCAGTVWDVPHRLDLFRSHSRALGRRHKPIVFNPQAFHGEGYWLRDPSVEESWVMVLLGVNHGAVGAVAWVWPTSGVLAGAHGQLARVLTTGEVVGFVVGGGREEGRRRVIGGLIPENVDVAMWVRGGRMLVSVVNGGYVDAEGVEVPVEGATVIEGSPWGNVSWKLEGGRLSVPVLPALATSLVVLELKG
ncbi:hypothetical protein C8A05DRAFT_15083 [Staphylotrichum tortipilum]|uniref:VOC domain-containing protein n=1 Tax=Staphylotrichum tortipilum TaxID=2831512 RepID=A0AAN6ML38_9PEZI|nr:hypothetical protein C8A05DRAFT_15083 [Staphylotrichum longicolle]